MTFRTAALASAITLGAPVSGAMAQTGETVSEDTRLTLGGSARVRYETLDNRFRAGRAGSDQLVSTRLRLRGDLDLSPVTLTAELSDGRGWLNDEGSQLSTSMINTLEPMRLHASLDLGAISEGDADGAVMAGRFPMAVGSARYIGISGDSNHPNTFDGVHGVLAAPGGWAMTGFYTAPVGSLPSDRASLLDNEARLDESDWDDIFWGVHGANETLAPGYRLEAYVYGLDEEDGLDILIPGARIQRPRAPGAYDFDVELIAQTGERGDQDMTAWGMFASAGYTFEARFAPRLSVQYQRYSGDEDPADGTSERFDPLFGSRGGDIGMTSIFGPINRDNVSAPGARFEMAEGPWEAQILYHAAWLASDTETWGAAGLRDVSGQSGDFIGHVIDAQYERELTESVAARAGAVALLKGEFATDAPQAPNEDDSLFVFFEIAAGF